MVTASQNLEVLVVEDDPDTLDVSTLLLQMPGVAITAARSGLAAIEHIKRSWPDVVLLDLAMPRISGYDVARVLHAQGANDSTLIAITGYGDEETKRRCAEFGFDLHLTKPIEFEVVRALLRTLSQTQQLEQRHGYLTERYRVARTALVIAQIEMAGTLLDVAVTTRSPETRQRCVAKASRACERISAELQDERPLDLTVQLVELEQRLSKLSS